MNGGSRSARRTWRDVNRQLETEVDERRATEQQLRQTQSDLIQAGKLAALGQMSAALSHEFNQPLAAVKAYAENGATLIDRDRVGDARDNLARISSLADRMSSISRHLRNFAREPNQTLGPVLLADAVKDTLEIVDATPEDGRRYARCRYCAAEPDGARRRRCACSRCWSI